MTTRDKDMGHEAIRRTIMEMVRAPGGGPHVQVGILTGSGKDETYDDGTTVIEVALWNEFGTTRIPERSFLRSTADETREERARLGEQLLIDVVLRKRGWNQTLRLMGVKYAAMIKKKITDLKSPPNAQSTIMAKARKKGRKRIRDAFKRNDSDGAGVLAQYNNPLVDTGQLRQSIDYKVVI